MRPPHKCGIRPAALATTGVLAVVGVAFTGVCLADSAPELKQKLLNAWSRRQERVISLSCDWVMSGQIRTSSLYVSSGRSVNAELSGLLHGEFSDVRQNASARFDDNRFDFRLDNEGGRNQRMLATPRYTFDGVQSYEYGGRPSRSDALGSGAISNASYAFGKNVLYVRPLIQFCRPMNESLSGIDAAALTLKGGPAMIGDHCCYLFRAPGKGAFHRQFWVDPANDFVVRRYESIVDARVSCQIDIAYRRDDEFGLLPQAWSCLSYDGDGNFDSSRMCEVTDLVVNADIPIEDFQIAFPKGTRVRDEVAGTTYISTTDEVPQRDSAALVDRSLLWTNRNLIRMSAIAVTLAVALLIRQMVRRRRRTAEPKE